MVEEDPVKNNVIIQFPEPVEGKRSVSTGSTDMGTERLQELVAQTPLPVFGAGRGVWTTTSIKIRTYAP